MPNGPARWPPFGRPETSRLLELDHYMLHVSIKMRLGAYASSRQDTDTDTGAGGSQVLRPPVHDERYGLTDIDVYTSDLKAVEYGQAGRVVETTFLT
jgi:hypothetical protein